MVKVAEWFPSAFFLGITFPLDQEMKFPSDYLVVLDVKTFSNERKGVNVISESSIH
jgi:hypothetical protein